MKKISLFLIIISLLLSACNGTNIIKKEEKVVEKNTKGNSIIPKYSISDNYYKTIIPLKEHKIINTVNIQTNSKLDIDKLELGLMNMACKQFDTKNHLLQRSEYIAQKTIDELLTKQEVPYVSNIIEYDYYTKKNSGELSLAGVVIGLAMTSNHSNEEANVKGSEIANQLLKVLYDNKNFVKVPITFSIFKQETSDSLKAGTFISSVTVQKGENSIGQWVNINEKSFAYPSDDFKQVYNEDNKKLDRFSHEVKKFTTADYDYIPVNATIFYKDDHMDTINMNVLVKFNGKSELIAFTQMIVQKILDFLPKDVKVQMNIKSEQKVEAVVVREKNEDKPFVSFIE
ncbi:CamS family sex pheromone protein [Bacillus pseudomycoides]|uniref:CamS family sex pheromone protein n=1 Tax=Bacillus pseudomycoides TaxID=64104 RepID=UPI000BED88AD|nr:CamS family sex pheromone protein [Bacillus pseudomycoides]MEB3055276.1 CamS family sex pheromone protein [Bacillus pseudomycoides]PEB38678.1 sex pheromone [Bacillus pseudomycoides]PGD92746.1 sex pheromone [Bacillus pseudomycoides]PGE02478.1 sex pheromone [Bacillus pseudomycoides]PHE66014.1 sex pheromone [Bacillus pseudomycoides]